MGVGSLMHEITVAGAGPAGAAAAIAARMEGCAVRVFDRGSRPRHKVCGEFISPGGPEILERLGAWTGFAALRPNRIERCVLHLGRHAKKWRLPECGWGLSRLQLDRMLLDRAKAMGAGIVRGEALDLRRAPAESGALILACGRRGDPAPGTRLFGFKAHFDGPTDDAVELFFEREAYAGVSTVENGITNVCGIAPEALLRSHGFDFDAFVARPGPLADRLRPLRRRIPWVVTGPVVFVAPSPKESGDASYAAGDALGFVDPFTGTGILNALLTGYLAGTAAARQIPSQRHQKQCASALGRPYLISSMLRKLVGCTELHGLVPWIPGQALFRLTRATVAAVL